MFFLNEYILEDDEEDEFKNNFNIIVPISYGLILFQILYYKLNESFYSFY